MTVSRAVGLGFFVGMFPIPFQMVVAGGLVAFLRARMGIPVNLPMAVASVWISNVATMAPIVYFQYRTGVWINSLAPVPVVPGFQRAQALTIGVLLSAALIGTLGYLVTRLLWTGIAKYLLHHAGPGAIGAAGTGGGKAGSRSGRRAA